MTATDEQRARVAEHIADLDYAGRTSEVHAFEAVLADSQAVRSLDSDKAEIDPRSLDLIAWALRLPLLREQRWEGRYADPAPDVKRLDALIAEGERALGILPPEGE